MTQLQVALASVKIKIAKYDPSKARPVITNIGTMDIRKFSSTVLKRLGAEIIKFPDVLEAAHDSTKMETALEELSELEGLTAKEEGMSIPPELQEYTLNVNMAAKKGEEEFFLTTKEGFLSRTSGKYYILKCRIPPPEIYNIARPVIPEYRPRSRLGVFQETNTLTGEPEKIYNTYIPPEWVLWKKKNPKRWGKLPSAAPGLFIKLLKHLIPGAQERRYFYSWLYTSMTSRSYVYLVLCGAPGTGKNRLKLVLRALHGKENTNDGKKSTITERFNSQLSTGTLTWYDELKYDSDMENVMKEIQNDYLSIEKKGVDATRSSTIYSSMVISNNKPRDNFIAFDARKFAPLKLASKDLRHSMTEEEIDILSKKVDPSRPEFDVEFVAQIAKWIYNIGHRNTTNYPNLEYRGPMFWTLAHTSMTQWQKKAISALVDNKTGIKIGWDSIENAHLWSKVEEKLVKRAKETTTVFPDYSTVRAFFEIFRDGSGQKAFDTKLVEGNNILGDFWIYPLIDSKVEIITEAKVNHEREKGLKDGEKEIYDI